MADKLNIQQRRQCMSHIRGKDTKPELLVRKGLHAHGFRFRLQDRRLPGKPDIVLAKYGVVIMVNGCFWHGHNGCKYATQPKSNVAFWDTKIAKNRHRDEVTIAHLEALGWTVIVVWECELRGKAAAETRIHTLADEIRSAGEIKKQTDKRRRLYQVAANREREQILKRHASLEEEIKRICHIPKKVRDASKEE